MWSNERFSNMRTTTCEMPSAPSTEDEGEAAAAAAERRISCCSARTKPLDAAINWRKVRRLSIESVWWSKKAAVNPR